MHVAALLLRSGVEALVSSMPEYCWLDVMLEYDLVGFCILIAILQEVEVYSLPWGSIRSELEGLWTSLEGDGGLSGWWRGRSINCSWVAVVGKIGIDLLLRG